MALVEKFVAEEAGFICLESPFDVPAASEYAREQRTQVRSLFRTKARNGGQTLACVPCRPWAEKVFPDLSPEEGIRELWKAVFSCTRCDMPDPAAAWNAYIEDVTARKQRLVQKGYQEFQYSGGGTQLTVRPADGDFWKGGCVRTPVGSVSPIFRRRKCLSARINTVPKGM